MALIPHLNEPVLGATISDSLRLTYFYCCVGCCLNENQHALWGTLDRCHGMYTVTITCLKIIEFSVVTLIFS